MRKQRRIRDYGIQIGALPVGPRNAISDVADVMVGHTTLNNEPHIRTGVTAVLPHAGNLFQEKIPAAVHIINGFGKSAGTIQVEELGTLETPILLTNTFGVGACIDALVQHALETNPEIGVTTGTVNPLVFECNDSYLNDIRGMHVKREHAFAAVQNATADFAEGSVGAGTGMSCYELKGGVGSSSRVVTIGGEAFTTGILVLTNMGRLDELIVAGRHVGAAIGASTQSKNNTADTTIDHGSIIIIVATDAPLTPRQLKRLSRRAGPGLSRTGNNIAGGSGEIVLAFSVAERLYHNERQNVATLRMLNEDRMDILFTATAECVEEAILTSMVTAITTEGRSGHVRDSLTEFLESLK